MRLTHLRVKEALAHKCTAALLDYRLNRVYERLLANGKFLGTLQRLVIAAPYGMLTLPRRYRSIEGVKVDGTPFDIGSYWYEFLPDRTDFTGYSLDAVRDLGEGWAVMRTPPLLTPTTNLTIPVFDFPTGGTITVTHFDTEEHPVTIEGRDENGLQLPYLVIPVKNTPVSCAFSRITRIHKEISKNDFPITVTFTDLASVDTIIAIMEPSEEETYYRRYMVDILATTPDVAVTAICKRRHVEIINDNEIVPIENLSAIEKGIDALQYEDQNDLTLADQYWKSAIKILNNDLFDASGSATFPAIRFKYPGHTTPHLTSHY